MLRLTVLLIGCLLPVFALAAAPGIRDDALAPHVVVKGDTLWGISATYLKNPWKWRDIWEINKDTVEDPHWIYPGQLIVLELPMPTQPAPTPPAPTPPPVVHPVISARIISIYGGVSQAGQHTVIIIDKGRRDGIENGLVLALYRGGKTSGSQDASAASSPLASPDAGYGQVQVFRTYDRSSYATVTQASLPVKLLDVAKTK